MFDAFEFSVDFVSSVFSLWVDAVFFLFMLPSIYLLSDCVRVSAFIICCVFP